MTNITLTEEDVIRLRVIDMDGDSSDALAFIRERLIAELKKRDGLTMRGHLDGGKGSMF